MRRISLRRVEDLFRASASAASTRPQAAVSFPLGCPLSQSRPASLGHAPAPCSPRVVMQRAESQALSCSCGSALPAPHRNPVRHCVFVCGVCEQPTASAKWGRSEAATSGRLGGVPRTGTF